MHETHIGLDINGLLDRSIQLNWVTGQRDESARLHLPVVVASNDRKASPLAGRSALLHPADRGWVRPTWKRQDIKRHRIADLLTAVAEGHGTDSTRLLGAHFRHMAGRAEAVGLAVPDDFTAEAQSHVIDAVGAAGRYDPKSGWRGLRANLLWRSVAAVFGWARDLPAQDISQLKDRPVKVVSLLADRILVSSLTLDVATVDGVDYVTPVRSSAGMPYSNPYPPLEIEDELVEQFGDKRLVNQLEAVGAGSDFIRGDRPAALVQDAMGKWRRAPAPPVISHEQRAEAVRAMSALLQDAGFDHDDGSLILVETPDQHRGFKDRSWLQFVALRLRKLLRLNEVDPRVIALQPDAVALGCADYAARLSLGLPTFFDYLPQIGIAALVPDGERYEFTPLLKSVKVAGNETYKQSLDGRFEVPAGFERITFYISKADEPYVRKSITTLPIVPDRTVQINLRVEQRPVSGHAHVDVLPKEPGALGATLIALDWRSMEVTEKSSDEILAELDKDRPKSYPNCAPTHTHISAWQALDLARCIQDFVSTPIGHPISNKYKHCVASLKGLMGRRVNPRLYGVAGGVDEILRPFDSNGNAPEGRLGLYGSPNDLASAMRGKIDTDFDELARRGATLKEAKALRNDLIIIGSWMFASAPNSVVRYFLSVAGGGESVGPRMQALGRVLCRGDEMQTALSFIARRLAERKQASPPWKSSTNELKAITILLEYYDDACKAISTKDATIALECATYIISAEIRGSGSSKKFSPQKFLWAVKTVLTILRHRKANPNFLAPPAEGEDKSKIYAQCLDVLAVASEEVKKSARKAPPIARDAVTNAIQFLEKTGGNPDIIQMISRSEDDADDGDGDDDG